MRNSNEAIDLSRIQTVQQADYQPAGNGKRVIAFILDSIFLTASQKLIFGLIHIENIQTKSLANSGFWLATIVLYWSYGTYRWGGSAGKLIMGLRVIRADGQEQVGFGRLLYRESIGRLVSVLTLGLGYLWVAWDPQRRTFHDMIAKTRVIDYKN